MTFANTEMKQFKDLTPEQRSEIVEAWLKGNVEFSPNDREVVPAWSKKEACGELCSYSIYRVKPSPKLDIPWHLFKHEWKWAAKDQDGSICLYAGVPRQEAFCWQGVDVGFTEILNHNFEPDGEVDWKQSLIQRPIGE